MRCELLAGHPDFRRLDTIDAIRLDLRYAGSDNFVGRDLYGELDCAWLHREAADALERAAVFLDQHHAGYQLLVLDALRPHRVQEMLWQYLAGSPLQMYVADPARGSVHSFGMAVDVTVCDPQGRELDMGSGFDEFAERSHPVLEAQLRARGELSQVHICNRDILRAAMSHAGFHGIHSEWWHFNLGSVVDVRQHYLRID
ncbi:M15 family metallopeptidase [Undibacterium rugosum]|uniref:M15 family metallopeptidase n=1 Tax=Undibacterium rugosum TaxID=2762291 RepID=UPI001B82A1AB|nr:M15 family metallopeptidase [Undibacterium rugosum]MBR7778536.1 M15 family metallopeptidase [Undibacterium rugosum]